MGMDVTIKGMDKGKQAKSWLTPNAEVGYFRDCYNSASLANWLTQNIDPYARGEWGLAIFDTDQAGFNTDAWRRHLLKTVLKWQAKAEKFRGKPSYVGYPGERLRVSADKTADYLDWLAELVAFARKVVEMEAEVEVWG